FDKSDVLKADGTPYTVYTPYAKRWKERLSSAGLSPVQAQLENLYRQDFSPILSLADIGFEKTMIRFEAPVLNAAIIDDYDKYRDFPALQRTTQLGVALRFGAISIRACVAFAMKHNETW